MSETENGTSKAAKVKPKCARCGKVIEKYFTYPPGNLGRVWCEQCVQDGLVWGLERYTEAVPFKEASE